MKVSTLFLRFKVCIFIMLALMSLQAKAEYYLVHSAAESGPSMVFTSDEGCHSCQQSISSCPVEQEYDQVPDMTINSSYMDQEGDEDNFNPDMRTADDVFSDLEIN